MNEKETKARLYLSDRKKAYQITFNKEDKADSAVLADLAKFCRAGESCFSMDDRTSNMLEGRREVWLRIQQHLNLDEETLWTIFNRRIS